MPLFVADRNQVEKESYVKRLTTLLLKFEESRYGYIHRACELDLDQQPKNLSSECSNISGLLTE